MSASTLRSLTRLALWMRLVGAMIVLASVAFVMPAPFVWLGRGPFWAGVLLGIFCFGYRRGKDDHAAAGASPDKLYDSLGLPVDVRVSTSDFERVAAEAVPVLKAAEPPSVVAVILLPDGELMVDPTAHGDIDDAARSCARMSVEHAAQFADLAQMFTVTEGAELGEHIYHITHHVTDGLDFETLRLPA